MKQTRFYPIISLLLCALMPLASLAQTRYGTDGFTPNEQATGSPAGSFALDNFDTINLFNGRMNFFLPLLNAGGRGKGGHTIGLGIEQSFTVQRDYIPFQGGVYKDSVIDARLPKPIRYSPGLLYFERTSSTPGAVQQCVNTVLLTRAHFIDAVGTDTVLVDEKADGSLGGDGFVANVCANPNIENNRGRKFTSVDRTMTFIADADIIEWDTDGLSNGFYPSGTLIFSNGVRYKMDGNVKEILDSNGNKINFSYDSSGLTAITDNLNRQITISNNFNPGAYDAITFKGYGGSDRTIKVYYSRLEHALRPGSNLMNGNDLWPGLLDQSTTLRNPIVVSRVELPKLPGETADRSYYFYYDSYAQLARVILPTGGGYDYNWVTTRGDAVIIQRVTRRVTYNTLSSITDPNNPPAGSVSAVQEYSTVSDGQTRTVNVKSRDGLGELLTESDHYFYDGAPTVCNPTAYAAWYQGKEFKVDRYQVTGGIRGSVVRTIDRTFDTAIPALRPDCVYPRPATGRVISETLTLKDAVPNLVKKTQYAYDNYGNAANTWESDFGPDAPGALLRRTEITYLTTNGNQGNVNYATDVNIHIRNLPVRRIVYDASGNVRSQTDYIYDNYGGDYPLVDRPGIVQHDDGFSTGYGARGNLTGVVFHNPGSIPSEIHLKNQYDIAGNLVKVIDGRTPAGITTFEFNDRFDSSPDDEAQSNDGAPELAGGFTYAFPTKMINALGHSAYTQYDYYLGRAVNSEDANGVVSSVEYNDPLDRPTQSIQARYVVGTGVPAVRRQTTITYDDTNRVVTTSSDRDTFNDTINSLTSKSYYDGLGRTWRSAADEGSTWSITDRQFDALGRVSQVSNPYRAADPESASPPPSLWTMTTYDALSRVIQVTTPDSAHVDTTYNGNQVTVTDQAGKSRRSETNALGRLIKVTEDPGGLGLNFDTYYSYDALDNLRQVTQGSQTRTFVYDSLSRLTSATNPENGTISYAYDANGNLIEKTDARGVKTTMTYDALNRVISKVYSGLNQAGTEVANATPTANYVYDDYSTLPGGGPTWPTWSCGGQTLPNTPVKGRLIGVTYGAGSDGTYYRYDATGQIVGNLQRMGTPNFVTRYTYNLAGAVLEECRGYSSSTRAAVRNISAYDDAGRLTEMRTSFTPHTSSKYLVQGISYTPFGALQTEKYGNGLIHSIGYNNRLQPTEIRQGRPDNLESVFTIYNLYGTAANPDVQDPEITLAQNNGNIARIKYVISGALQYSQTFQYDPLNRLKYAVEHENGAYNDAARAWRQTFEYDFAGNRGVDTLNTSDNVDGLNSALRLAEFSGANNRITRPGYSYDAAGNLTEEPGKRYTYNAENKLVTAEVVLGATSQYVYDGNGRRVKKTVSGVGTRFEYGVGGELIAERDDAGVVTNWYYYRNGELLATSVNGTTHKYVASDHLGSPRAWTDDSGAMIAGGRHDYLPFGEELLAGVGTRAAEQGYANNKQQDGQRKQFGSKERDIETGLDYFLARYYSSMQGRFTSPDIPFVDQFEHDPQSWNLYTYARNNPLQYIDPLGLAKRDANGNWVGEEDGEYDKQTGLYWNAKKQLWENRKNDNASAGDIRPDRVIMVSGLYSEYLARYGKYVRTHSREDGMIKDPTQSPLMRLIAPRWIDPSGFTYVEFLKALAAWEEEMLDSFVPAGGGIKKTLPPELRKQASKTAGEILKKWIRGSEGDSIGRSGGAGAAYKSAGNELIQMANKVIDPQLREALKIEGKRLIEQGNGHSHK